MAAVSDQDQPQSPSDKPNKRFQCSRCQRRFARLEHLQRHGRTHTQERPFSCTQCESRFNRSDLLTRHKRLSHKRNGSTSHSQQSPVGPSEADSSSNPQRGTKRPRVSSVGECDLGLPQDEAPLSSPPPPTSSILEAQGPAATRTGKTNATAQSQSPSATRPSIGHMFTGHEYQSPLAALSLAAEQTAFQDALNGSSAPTYAIPADMLTEPFVDAGAQSENMPQPVNMVDPQLTPMDVDLGESLDDFTPFLETGPLPTYHFTSWVTTEQPIPFSPFGSLIHVGDVGNNPNELGQSSWGHGQDAPEDPASFSRFGSRLPSLQPEEHTPDLHTIENASRHHHNYPICSKKISNLSSEDRELMLRKISEFSSVPPDFRLPTTLSLARYIRAYINGFHEHLPFLHIPSMSIEGCAIELLLAMAAVGAQYCFEAEKGVELFHVSRAIATERIRRRDVTVTSIQHGYEPQDSAGSVTSSPVVLDQGGSTHGRIVNGPLGLPSEAELSTTSPSPNGDLIQSAQALLILMAMATWAKHKEILREALAIQSILASIVRDDGLRNQGQHEVPGNWGDWIRHESTMRTKYIVFCFFNLHCIVYDIPPLILNSEIQMRLPCSAAEFKASTAAKWQEARARAGEPSTFQDALRSLFYRGGTDTTEWHSSLGNYVLIHAIIQDIFFARQTARCRSNSSELTTEDVTPLEHALRNWQLGWERNPESSVDPSDPNGPVAFNSTALLRLAYIRLNVNTGPGRALGTRDPVQIAYALRDTPAIKRSPKLVRALLHSAHALSIPVKIGIWLVAKTQTFIWSIQHSLCSLECALLLSKWLETVSASGPSPDPPITDEERKILSFVKSILDETDYAVPSERARDLPEKAKHLNVGVLRAWATIFKGVQTWAIVDVIGSSLNIYADLLEAT
ncbi:Fc.00g000380.m01.CDS01 [Cosmosporella sp. VM-42]